MLSGWTKRWRKRWEKGYHKDLLMWALMDYFIDFAAFEPTERYIPGAGTIKLQRGEWAFTERELSEFFGVNRQRIRTCIKNLSNPQTNPFINPISNPKHTVVKVINYDTYQSDNIIPNPISNPTSNPQTNPKRVSTIREEIKKRDTKNKTRHQLPENFVISETMKAFAAKNGINGSRVESVFDHFCDNHRSKGNKMLDWEAAWRTWIRNEIKWSKGKYTSETDGPRYRTLEAPHD